MTIKKYKKYLRVKESFDIFDLRYIKRNYISSYKKFEQNLELLQKIVTYMNNTKVLEVDYYWSAPNWIYEVVFENSKFRIYPDEFEEYFTIDLKKTRKLKLEKLNSVQI